MKTISKYFSIHLSVDENQVIGEPIKGKFKIKNITDQEIAILKWYTPLEDLSSSIFSIYDGEGSLVPYEGILRKRGPISESDFIIFQSGEEVEVTFDLSENYYLEFQGQYILTYNPRFKIIQNPNLNSFPGWINQSKTILGGDTIEIKFFLKSTSKKNVKQPIKTFNRKSLQIISSLEVKSEENIKFGQGFSQTQKDDLFDCTNKAISILKNSIKKLNAREDIELFEKWFGIYKEERYLWVINIYNDVFSSITSDNYYYLTGALEDCKLNTPAYADRHYKSIYYCNSFWSMNNQTYDTKAGIIIHELIHCVKGFEDDFEGEDLVSSIKLAKKSPSRAISNPNNYEYFSESIKVRIEV